MLSVFWLNLDMLSVIMLSVSNEFIVCNATDLMRSLNGKLKLKGKNLGGVFSSRSGRMHYILGNHYNLPLRHFLPLLHPHSYAGFEPQTIGL